VAGRPPAAADWYGLDADGTQTDPTGPLLAAATAPSAWASPLTLSQVDLLLAEAARRWQAAGVDTTTLAGVNVRIADLPGSTLGLASGNTIYLDVNAAGWGWFVDTTPADDSEFSTPGNQGEQGHMDLLTVVMHEMGHVLGLDHDAKGVMQETLDPGTRLSPSRLDLYFAGPDDMADVALALSMSRR
jgi:hypothetical protein